MAILQLGILGEIERVASTGERIFQIALNSHIDELATNMDNMGFTTPCGAQ